MLDMDQIRELAAGAEFHLRKIGEFSDRLKDMIESLNAIKRAQEDSYRWELNLLRQEFADIKSQLKKYGLPEANEYERKLRQLREMVEGDQWPQAVKPESICLTAEQANQRAQNILDIVVGEHLEDRKFLDFGCGDGRVVNAASTRKAKLAVGFDVDLADCLGGQGEFTANFDVVQQNAPYDVILVHDVLDHIVQVDPVTALHQIRSVLDKDGKAYIRNHPWCSRHGGHLYKSTNKAFLHLVLDEVELTRIGGWQCDHNIKVITPLETYRDWFVRAGFQVRSEVPIRKNVEDFFFRPSHIHDRLLEHWNDVALMRQNMEIDFVEFIVDSPSNQKVF